MVRSAPFFVRRHLHVAIAAVLIAGTAGPALAQQAPLPPCDMSDRDWRADPVLTESRRQQPANVPIRSLTCQTVEGSLEAFGSDQLRVLRAKVFESAGPEQGVNIVTLIRKSGESERVIARFLVPYDVSRDEPSFFPRLSPLGGDAFVLQLGERIRTAYRIVGDAVTPFDSHAFAEAALAAAGAGWSVGQVRRVDFMQMAGFVSVFPAKADDPATPGSAFDPGKAVEVALGFEGDRLVARSAKLVEPQFIQDVEDWTALVESQEEARKARRRLPPGTEPCEISGWSIDTDPAGLNVRAEPSATARVVGRVPPPRISPRNGVSPGETWRAGFRIEGYRSGWFLIRAITAPGAEYGDAYPRSAPQPYRGKGWVSARMVGGALAHGGLPSGQLLQAPSRHAAIRPVRRPDGEPISTGDVIQRLHACSGGFGLIEIEGVRGWWAGLCSNQVTNCS